MAISVKRLSGTAIPEHLRDADPGLEVIFQVEDGNGKLHYRQDDVEAAALAVALSERDRSVASDD